MKGMKEETGSINSSDFFFFLSPQISYNLAQEPTHCRYNIKFLVDKAAYPRIPTASFAVIDAYILREIYLIFAEEKEVFW